MITRDLVGHKLKKRFTAFCNYFKLDIIYYYKITVKSTITGKLESSPILATSLHNIISTSHAYHCAAISDRKTSALRIQLYTSSNNFADGSNKVTTYLNTRKFVLPVTLTTSHHLIIQTAPFVQYTLIIILYSCSV